ncbi:hypothetical protein G6669_04935 [Polynucleobacter paneuropaeus]|nr:hypothetical protein G6669_04935 [Polynucleobacter paneuropaeus]
MFNRNTRLLKFAILCNALIILVGCSGLGGPSSQSARFASVNSTQKIAPPKQNVTHELVKQGIIYLREGDYESAQKVFSASVKVSPNSSTLHLLNGISYHLRYLNNSAESKELAETAYSLASTMDKSDPLPLVQMGRLHIDSAEYARASKDFVAAYVISPTNDDALFGLLQSSILQKDFKTALWAGEGLKKINTTDSEKLRLMTLTYAAVGKTSEANQSLAAYTKVNSDHPKEVDHLKQQLFYINTQLANLKSLDLDVVQNPASISLPKQDQGKMMKVAQRTDSSKGSSSDGRSATPNGRDNSNKSSSGTSTGSTSSSKSGTAAALDSSQNSNSDGSSSSDGTSSGSGGSSGSGSSGSVQGGNMPSATSQASSGGGGGTYTAVSMQGQKPRWFDCDSKPGLGKAPGGSYGVPVGGTSGDQTLYLEPLPSPCKNAEPPKMASIDAVLIRTVDVVGSQFGVNLLNGLQMFAGAQSFSSTGSSGGASVSGVVQNSVLGLGTATSATINSVSGLVSYSLNIANSTTTNSQVIARPTLTALDRIPSTFYSGGVITAGLNGGGVSGAQVTNIPTGVSLSVTPTFIDNESMMLAVKVSRSYVSATGAVGGFNSGVTTQQHAVTANVKVNYGETLILDGLTSREIENSQNGVPVLQDIPIIQYLFSQVVKSQTAENVIVLVTPRKIIKDDADFKTYEVGKETQMSPKEKSVYSAMKIYKEMVTNNDSNLDNTLNAMDRDSAYFRDFKNQALASNQDKWVSEPKIIKFLNDAANMVYFTR